MGTGSWSTQLWSCCANPKNKTKNLFLFFQPHQDGLFVLVLLEHIAFLFTLINQTRFTAAYNNKIQANLPTVALISILSIGSVLFAVTSSSCLNQARVCRDSAWIVTQKSLVGTAFRPGRLGWSHGGLGGVSQGFVRSRPVLRRIRSWLRCRLTWVKATCLGSEAVAKPVMFYACKCLGLFFHRLCASTLHVQVTGWSFLLKSQIRMFHVKIHLCSSRAFSRGCCRSVSPGGPRLVAQRGREDGTAWWTCVHYFWTYETVKKKMKFLTVGMRNMTSATVKPAQQCFTCEGHRRLLFRWRVARCVGSDSIFITIICSSFLPAGCALRSFASHLTKWKSSWKCFVLLQWKLVHWGGVLLAVLCALCSAFLPDAYQVGTLVPMT